MRAVLSIGSNLEDRYALLSTAVEEFREHLCAASGIYSTPPWGVEDQGEFLNAVLLVDVPESPMELLRRVQALEQAAHRRRVRRWGPRTLDVDIVDIPGFISANPELRVPHPHAYHRAFVLIPWLEIEPEAKLAGKPLSELLAQIDESEKADIVRVGEF